MIDFASIGALLFSLGFEKEKITYDINRDAQLLISDFTDEEVLVHLIIRENFVDNNNKYHIGYKLNNGNLKAWKFNEVERFYNLLINLLSSINIIVQSAIGLREKK